MRRFALLVGLCGFVFAVSPVSEATPAAPGSGAPGDTSGDKCGKLASLQLPNASVSSAKTYAAGTFSGPPQNFTGADLSAFFSKLPAFCRVVVKATPTSDSDITIEVWMPLEKWNGRLQGLGNGGFAGLIDHFELGAGIMKGYAATATDTGHTGSPIDAEWAVGHAEKVVDFGHRGIHEMTRVAKAVVQSFYGSGPSHAYFAGCSDGGREALMEAQRYPADYDGILAGAPANYWTALLSMGAEDTRVLMAAPANFIPPAKIPAIAKAVNEACDQLDGVSDGIVNDPRDCRFDPAAMECKPGEDSDKCLTAEQAATLETIYAGLKDSKGNELFPGYLPGAEDGGGGWATWITGPAPGKSLLAAFAGGYYSNMVYEKKDWDLKSFTVDGGMKDATEKTAKALNAIDADLTAFRSRGGKLILYHGWNDPAISPWNTIAYYQTVQDAMGAKQADSFVRLYMVPGMEHCAGGPGPSAFGQLGIPTTGGPKYGIFDALVDWTEKGVAPQTVIATKYDSDKKATMTRPLCPYPAIAKYKGTGDTNDAANFACSK